jgi:hypothetical protein
MSTGSLFVWVLFLNDMRMPKSEDLVPVVRAETPEALADFVESERVPLYVEPTGLPSSDGQRVYPQEWSKVFRKGGPLEWCNPPSLTDPWDGLHYRPVARVIDYSAEVNAIPEAQNLRRLAVDRLVAGQEHP